MTKPEAIHNLTAFFRKRLEDSSASHTLTPGAGPPGRRLRSAAQSRDRHLEDGQRRVPGGLSGAAGTTGACKYTVDGSGVCVAGLIKTECDELGGTFYLGTTTCPP